MLPHTSTPLMGFLCGFSLTFSFLLPQLSSPEMWLGGCDILGPEDQLHALRCLLTQLPEEQASVCAQGGPVSYVVC